MHLQLVKARSGKTIKRYARLVQSYRRDDGMPAQKIIANLGQLDDLQVANMRAALAASRKKKAVVFSEDIARKWPLSVLKNLAFLDLLVAWEAWRRWQLSELFDSLLPSSSELVRASDVIAILALQRCVAPGSKLQALSWFPHTALPELLGVEPSQFNNSRIHRVLEQVDRVDDQLQNLLPARYQHRDGLFASLFVDLTDTWFEGRGPDLAESGRTKEGLRARQKINILLLCNEHGYPVRWKVLPGDMQDPPALKELVGELIDIPWSAAVPIVFDRAMGGEQAVAQLCASGLHFLTAARRPEIGSYTSDIPYENLASLTVAHNATEKAKEATKKIAFKRMLEAGMERVDDDLLVADLGSCVREFRLDVIRPAEIDPATLRGGAKWLFKAREFQRELDTKKFLTRASLAKHHGVSQARVSQIMNLLRLDRGLQEDVLEGLFGALPETELGRIAQKGRRTAQKRALQEWVDTHTDSAPQAQPKRKRRVRPKIQSQIRLVLYFNPQMFVDQCQTASKSRHRLEEFVIDLNIRLRHSSRSRKPEAIRSEVETQLGRHAMRSLCSVELDGGQEEPWHVSLHFDEEAWAKRHRYDGFVLLLAHPGIGRSAQDVVQLYRDKDKIERDFRTIKTDLEIRPVFHHSDPKVRAHVSLCMLSLLLERTIERQLRASGQPMTAPAAFETLAPCHLNVLLATPQQDPTYAATVPDPEQRQMLEALGMTHLIDPEKLPDMITPRSSF